MVNIVTKLFLNVEIMCKKLCKTLCISPVKLCVKFKYIIFSVQNSTFPPTFPFFSTHFLTTRPHLYLINVFHYSTHSTNTTIKI